MPNDELNNDFEQFASEEDKIKMVNSVVQGRKMCLLHHHLEELNGHIDTLFDKFSVEPPKQLVRNARSSKEANLVESNTSITIVKTTSSVKNINDNIANVKKNLKNVDNGTKIVNTEIDAANGETVATSAPKIVNTEIGAKKTVKVVTAGTKNVDIVDRPEKAKPSGKVSNFLQERVQFFEENETNVHKRNQSIERRTYNKTPKQEEACSSGKAQNETAGMCNHVKNRATEWSKKIKQDEKTIVSKEKINKDGDPEVIGAVTSGDDKSENVLAINYSELNNNIFAKTDSCTTDANKVNKLVTNYSELNNNIFTKPDTSTIHENKVDGTYPDGMEGYEGDISEEDMVIQSIKDEIEELSGSKFDLNQSVASIRCIEIELRKLFEDNKRWIDEWQPGLFSEMTNEMDTRIFAMSQLLRCLMTVIDRKDEHMKNVERELAKSTKDLAESQAEVTGYRETIRTVAEQCAKLNEKLQSVKLSALHDEFFNFC